MKIPSAGTPIGVKDILRAFFNPLLPPFNSPLSKGGYRGVKGGMGGFSMEDALKSILKVKHCFLVNSGTTALYVILKTLIKISNLKSQISKKEILLPAYTAPSLVLPIKKAGLSYRLVDMSLRTFNMDEDAAVQAINEQTLAVLPIHLFGLPSPIDKLIALRKEINFYIIEDAASSFGTRYENGFYSGTRGDVGFISFNRGKNISTIAGGAIVINDDTIVMEIKKEVEALPEPVFIKRLRIYLEGIGLSFAVRPWFYTVFYPMLSRFKKTTIHEDFESYRYTSFQRTLGLSLIKKAEPIFKGREGKGRYLYEALKGLSEIRLPSIQDGWHVVFNQFPIIVPDPIKRDIILKRIVKAGIEATTLYDKPIHEIYTNNLRDSNDPFPNATYMAKRLLLIPTHPFIEIEDLEKVVEIILSEFHR